MLKPFILLVLLSTLSFSASANLSLSKFRLYFDQSNRTDALQIRNRADRPLDYSIELGLVAMTEEGTLRTVQSDPFSAIDLMRYSPRRGRLAPGERQALRFSVRKPASLPEGEYRAVLKISSVPVNTSTGSVAVQSKLSYSLPIVVRHGRLSASTELTDVKMVTVDNTPSLEIWQLLEGNRSVFGNFIVEDDDGNEVGVLNNSAVYLPLTRKKVIIPLSQKVTGKITVKYDENAEYGGSEKAEISLTID